MASRSLAPPLFLLQLVVSMSIFAAAAADDRLLPVDLRFAAFVRDYNKEYGTAAEYRRRLAVFARNLARAAEHQALDPTAVHGVTPFSDLTEEEFERTFTGLATMSSDSDRGGSGLPVAPPVDVSGLPENFDWREKGAVTGVKMQGACGSCWAFSAAGAAEGANFVASGQLVGLSVQQLIDCDHTCGDEAGQECNKGCNGGLMTNAYKYVMEAGGLQEESTYPYTGRPGAACAFDAAKVAVRLGNFMTIGGVDEGQVAGNLVRRGPLAVAVNAVFMQTYVGGVSCPLVCWRRRVNHGVLLVGYGSGGFSMLRMRRVPYWVIKNSWGERWGEGGYYRLCRGRNACGVASMVSAVTAAPPPKPLLYGTV